MARGVYSGQWSGGILGPRDQENCTENRKQTVIHMTPFDINDNEISPGDTITYISDGSRHVGKVEYDHNYRGGMRVNGRSIADIMDHCHDISIVNV